MAGRGRRSLITARFSLARTFFRFDMKIAPPKSRTPAQKPSAAKPRGFAKASEPSSRDTTAQDVRDALKANLARLEAKVKKGELLATHERRLVESLADGGSVSDPNYVSNASDLARILGIARQSIHRWMHLPGCPGRKADGRYEVSAWRRFKQSRPSGGGPESDALKRERLRLQNEKLEHQIEQFKRTYVALADVEKWNLELCDLVRRVVPKIRAVASEVVGMSIPECEARLKDLEFQILTDLRGGARAL